MSVVFTDTDIA